MPQDKTQTQLDSLSGEVQDLLRRVRSIENTGQGGSSIAPDSINRRIGTLERKIIEDTIFDSVFDLVWNKYFYYHTFFEEIGVAGTANNGWGLVDSSAASLVNALGVYLTTGAVTDNVTYIVKGPIYQNIITYDLEQGFRTSFKPYAGTANQAASNIYYYAGIGDGRVGLTDKHYGFRLENSTLLATVADGSTEVTKTVLTNILNENTYHIEARFYPPYKIVFYVSDANSSVLKERCTITTKLPTGVNVAEWFLFHVRTRTAAAKSVGLSSVEYIQKRTAI